MTIKQDSSTPKLLAPEGNDNVLEKAAAPLATLSSHSDPWPHYIMSGACEYHGIHLPAGMQVALASMQCWTCGNTVHSTTDNVGCTSSCVLNQE